MKLNKKWTNEALKEEALKYKTRSLFQTESSSAYVISRKRGILNEICQHMPIYDKKGKNNPRYVWSNEMLKKEALKYNKLTEFRKKSRGAYEACKRRKILKQLTDHMIPIYKKWTNEALKEEALKYKTRSEFEVKNIAAYSAALTRKIMNSICSHMSRPSLCKEEKELLNKIKEVYSNAKSFRDMKVKIKNKPYIKGFDIDIFIPELNKGIEFDGTYYHSFAGLKRSRKNWPDKDLKNYHKLKDKWFKNKGITILHIKEKDWYKNKELCIKKCLDFLSLEAK